MTKETENTEQENDRASTQAPVTAQSSCPIKKGKWNGTDHWKCSKCGFDTFSEGAAKAQAQICKK